MSAHGVKGKTSREQDVLGGLPRWVWDVVAAIDRYEGEHPQLFRQVDEGKFSRAGNWGCIDHIAALVPESTRDLAKVLIEAGVLDRDEAS